MAIRRLVKRGKPVTFHAVHREAGVSQNFLCSNPDLRARIEHHRQERRPVPHPAPPGTDSDNIITALTAEITRLKTQQRREVTELRKALEQAHGENLVLRRTPAARLAAQQPAVTSESLLMRSHQHDHQQRLPTG